jgi:hypothetical protein
MHPFPVFAADTRRTGGSRRFRWLHRAALAVLAALQQSRERMAKRIIREQRALLDKGYRAAADRSEPT